MQDHRDPSTEEWNHCKKALEEAKERALSGPGRLDDYLVECIVDQRAHAVRKLVVYVNQLEFRASQVFKMVSGDDSYRDDPTLAALGEVLKK